MGERVTSNNFNKIKDKYFLKKLKNFLSMYISSNKYFSTYSLGNKIMWEDTVYTCLIQTAKHMILNTWL